MKWLKLIESHETILDIYDEYARAYNKADESERPAIDRRYNAIMTAQITATPHTIRHTTGTTQLEKK